MLDRAYLIYVAAVEAYELHPCSSSLSCMLLAEANFMTVWRECLKL